MAERVGFVPFELVNSLDFSQILADRTARIAQKPWCTPIGQPARLTRTFLDVAETTQPVQVSTALGSKQRHDSFGEGEATGLR
jgi:hypothetical protein